MRSKVVAIVLSLASVFMAGSAARAEIGVPLQECQDALPPPHEGYAVGCMWGGMLCAVYHAYWDDETPPTYHEECQGILELRPPVKVDIP